MSSETDWRVSTLIKQSADQFEEHSKRIGDILDEARKRFNRDYTGTTAGVGIVTLLASVALSYIHGTSSATMVGIISGAVILLTALVYRHKTQDSQLKYAHTLVELERERARFAQRTAVLQHIWLYGLPEGTPLAQIRLLLGENPAVHQEEEKGATWKQLLQVETDKSADAQPSGEKD